MSVTFTYEISLPTSNVGRALAALKDLAPRWPSEPDGGTIVVLPGRVGSRTAGYWVPFSNEDGRSVIDCSDGTDLVLRTPLLVEPDYEVRFWLWGGQEELPAGAVDASGRVALESIFLCVRFVGHAPGYAVMRFTALHNAVGSTFYSSPNVEDMFIGLTVAAGGVCCGWEAEPSRKSITFLNGQRVWYGVGGPDSDFPTMTDVATAWPVLSGEQGPSAPTKPVTAAAELPAQHHICVGRIEVDGELRAAFVIDQRHYPGDGEFRRAVTEAHAELARHSVRGELMLTLPEYAESALSVPTWADYREQLSAAGEARSADDPRNADSAPGDDLLAALVGSIAVADSDSDSIAAADEMLTDLIAQAGAADAVTDADIAKVVEYDEDFFSRIGPVLTSWLHNEFDVVIPDLARMLNDLEAVLGSEHLATNVVRSFLAEAYWRTGNSAAVDLYRDSIAGLTQVLGPDHPRVRADTENLAEASATVSREGTDKPPMFFRLFNSTYRIESDSTGNRIGYLLNLRSGRIEMDTSQSKMWDALNSGESEELDEDRYVELTEAIRAHNLSGDGPIFALYDTISAIHGLAEHESRQLTSDEQAMIRSIRQRTYRLWEDEFTRR